MGKRVSGAALRAKKRAKEAVDALQEEQAEYAVKEHFTAKADEQLFVLDPSGDRSAASKVLKPKKKNEKPTGLSEKDKAQVEKLMKEHDAEKLVALAKEGRERLQRKRTTKQTEFDLWDETPQEAKSIGVCIKPGIGSSLAGTAPPLVSIKGRPSSRKRVKAVPVDLARSGQSYHPEPIAHQKLIETATSIELNRERVVKEHDRPLAVGISKETRSLLVGDSDEESSGEDNEETQDSSFRGILKRSEKLTKAQRNKQKRLRQEKAVVEKAKKERRLLNEVSEIPRYKKEMKREANEKLSKKEQLDKVVQVHKRTLGTNLDEQLAKDDPINAPSVPVALSEELRSSLRQVKPKGNPVTDRMSSLIDRNLAPKRKISDGPKRRKKRRLNVRG